jgi:transcription initiation factor TFIID subunit TAF12
VSANRLTNSVFDVSTKIVQTTSAQRVHPGLIDRVPQPPRLGKYFQARIQYLVHPSERITASAISCDIPIPQSPRGGASSGGTALSNRFESALVDVSRINGKKDSKHRKMTLIVRSPAAIEFSRSDPPYEVVGSLR